MESLVDLNTFLCQHEEASRQKNITTKQFILTKKTDRGVNAG